jgi:septin family protein
MLNCVSIFSDQFSYNEIIKQFKIFFSFCYKGFGDAVNNTGCWLPVTEYIENQFDKFLEAEQRVHR